MSRSNAAQLLKILDPSGDVQAFANAAHDFSQSVIRPLDHTLDERNAFPHALWKQLGDQSLLGVTIPEEYGGLGQGYLAHLAIMEEISRASGSIGLSYIAHSNLCMNQIALNASDEQKQKYLPGLVAGDNVGALAMSEPGAGSDVMSMTLRADAVDGGFLLNGRKQWITNGGTADVLVVYAKTDPVAGSKGVTTFLIEKGMPGFSPGKKENKEGMRGSETYELIFEDCFVPASQVMGPVNGGAKVLMRGLNYERLLLAGGPLGLAQSALDTTIAHTSEREQFGKPLAANQALAHEIAAMHSRLLMARSHAYMAAAAADQQDLTNDLAASVFYECSDTAMDITRRCITLCGGMGFTRDLPLGRYHRDAELYEIGGGARHIRLDIIARYLLPAYEATFKRQPVNQPVSNIAAHAPLSPLEQHFRNADRPGLLAPAPIEQNPSITGPEPLHIRDQRLG